MKWNETSGIETAVSPQIRNIRRMFMPAPSNLGLAQELDCMNAAGGANAWSKALRAGGLRLLRSIVHLDN